VTRRVRESEVQIGSTGRSSHRRLPLLLQTHTHTHSHVVHSYLSTTLDSYYFLTMAPKSSAASKVCLFS
jgi:hypothetical protein